MTNIGRRALLSSTVAVLALAAVPKLALAATPRYLVGHGVDELFMAVRDMPRNGVGVENIRVIYMTPAEYYVHIRKEGWRHSYEGTYGVRHGEHLQTMAYLMEHSLIQVRDPQVAYDGDIQLDKLAWKTALGLA